NGGHDHARGAVVLGEIGAQALGREGAHGVGRAENRAADRLVGKSSFLKEIENDVVGRVVGRADLLQDHALLARELVRVEGRAGENVRENIERKRHVLAEDARVVAGVLKAGGGVKIAAGVLDLLHDLPRVAPRRALEGHMYEQVRDAMLMRILVARTRTDPDAERGRAQVVHAVGDDRQAAVELFHASPHAAAPTARLRSETKRATASALAGRRTMRSGRSSRSERCAGSAGRTPIAASTASGNLAGCAVESATSGPLPSAFSLRAT